MTLPEFATQTITVLRAGTVTDHGTVSPDWTAATSRQVAGCSVQPASGSEDQTNRDAVTTLATLYGPLGADLLDTDRIVYGGITYDINGPIRRWDTGVMDHIEATLRAVKG